MDQEDKEAGAELSDDLKERKPNQSKEKPKPIKGDKLSATNTGDSSAIAIGRSARAFVINIYSSTYGLVFLGLVLVVISGVAVYLFLHSASPPKMTGEFNIAVASFSMLDGSTPSPVGQDVALVFSRRLEAELSYFADQSTTIKVFQILPPSQTGTISGKTSEERALRAKALAKEINAQLVIYGTVEKQGNDYIVSPEFVVAIRYIKDAEELLGQYRLGSPITIKNSIDNLPSVLAFNRELSDRSSALASITLGMFNYFVERYPEALSYYKKADDVSGWQPKDGKEVLYVLMGNAAAKNGKLEEALKFYTDAQATNADYARGYIGLATVTFRQAITDPSKIDYPKVEESILLFQKAMSAKDRPASSFVDFKARFGLGEARLLLTQARKVDLLIAAQDDFLYVTNFYRSNPEELLRDRASQAQAHLGLVAYIQGAPMNQVREHYDQAATIARDYDLDLAARYWEQLGLLYQKQNDLVSASDMLTQAIKMTTSATDKRRIEAELEIVSRLLVTPRSPP